MDPLYSDHQNSVSAKIMLSSNHLNSLEIIFLLPLKKAQRFWILTSKHLNFLEKIGRYRHEKIKRQFN